MDDALLEEIHHGGLCHAVGRTMDVFTYGSMRSFFSSFSRSLLFDLPTPHPQICVFSPDLAHNSG